MISDMIDADARTLDEMVAELNDELNANGLQKVIDEVNAQIAAWQGK